MKNKLLYLIVSLVVFFSCEENEDGYYDNIPRIYFPEETDSLSFSFGDKVAEYTRHTIKVPVKMMGLNAVKEMKFKVVLNKELSTAEEGVHFSPIQPEYTLAVDSVNAYVPIELIRDNLSEDEVTYKIVLDLEANTDFELGSKENLRAVVTFNNYLEEPSWWMNMFVMYTVNYHRGMYQRLIAYYGEPLTEEFCFSNYLKVMFVFKREVYDYAQEHPDLTQDWEFYPEEQLWWPFE